MPTSVVSAVHTSDGRRRPFHRALLSELRVTPHLSGVAAWRALKNFLNSNNLTYASSIAYFALLSLFPLLLLLLSLLGTLTADTADRQAVLDFILRYFPRQFDFVTAQVDAFRARRVTLGVAGSLLMLWAALGVFGAITTAVNFAWNVEQHPNYLKHKLVAFVMLSAAGVLFASGVALLGARSVVEASWFAGVVERTPGLAVLSGFAVRWGTTAVLIVCVGLIFYFVPNTNRVRFRDVWVGAVLTGLLWRITYLGFSWYVRDLSRFSVHGSIAAVVVFLTWVYMSAVVLLYGVEFTVAYAALRRLMRGELEDEA